MLEVGLRERLFCGGGRHRAGEEHHEIAEFLPGAWPHGVTRPVAHRQITSLEVDEQCGIGRQRFELGGLADARETNQGDLGAVPLAHPFVG